LEVVFTDTEKKEIKRNREHTLTFRVNDEERELVEQGMKQSGINNMRAYLLKMAVNGQIIHIELDSVKEMVRLLSNATNNLNQIARRVNGTGNLYAADIDDLREKYNGLWGQAKEVLRILSDFKADSVVKLPPM
jgi:hypothetical protein